jgi:hypothetical protein
VVRLHLPLIYYGIIHWKYAAALQQPFPDLIHAHILLVIDLRFSQLKDLDIYLLGEDTLNPKP